MSVLEKSCTSLERNSKIKGGGKEGDYISSSERDVHQANGAGGFRIQEEGRIAVYSVYLRTHTTRMWNWKWTSRLGGI
jgi:hypothetical protein